MHGERHAASRSQYYNGSELHLHANLERAKRRQNKSYGSHFQTDSNDTNRSQLYGLIQKIFQNELSLKCLVTTTANMCAWT